MCYYAFLYLTYCVKKMINSSILILFLFMISTLDGMMVSSGDKKILIPQGCIAVFESMQKEKFIYLSSVQNFVDYNNNISCQARVVLQHPDHIFIFYQQENRLEIFNPHHGLLGLAYKMLFCNWSVTYSRFIDSYVCFEKPKSD